MQPYGRIITKRVITNGGVCKGVGFCRWVWSVGGGHSFFYPQFLCVCVCTYRMENVEVCKKVIEMLDKANLPGTTEGIMVKFADANHRRKTSE